MQLYDKVAIITGASNGIGQAGARLFAREGAKVVIAARGDKLGEETAGGIRDEGGEATFVHTDTSKVADMENLVKTAVKTYGKIDIFWHNAGVFFRGHIDLIKEADFDLQMATCVKGGVFGTKFVIKEMRQTGGGCILFTSSTAGLKPNHYNPQYSLTHGISKAALIMLMRSLVEPLAKDNIRINCLCPGAVRTQQWDEDQVKTAAREGTTVEEIVKRMAARTPMNRLMTMEEMADAALFLVSDRASAITGVALAVDGGFAAI